MVGAPRVGKVETRRAILRNDRFKPRTIPMRLLFACLIAVTTLSLGSAPAFADKAAADACAAKLPANAKLIYAAAIGGVTPGADLNELVRSKTRPLVMSGKIGRDQAMGAAQAAGTCLQQAK
jgi:hypothetical protein